MSVLPESIREGIGEALDEMRAGCSVTAAAPVRGGCINNGVRISTSDGGQYFLKWNPTAPHGMFTAEVAGLDALHAARSLRVPRSIALRDEGSSDSWLLMEYIPKAPHASDSDLRLGIGLAAVHDAGGIAPLGLGEKRWGWDRDNWIGSLAQRNTPSTSWAEFWRSERIEPQLALARSAGQLGDQVFDRLVEVIEVALGGVDRLALLHGDLWSGNTYVTEGGEPVLIDPAVFRGDGEVDLAMADLFGGFGRSFFDAYADVRVISHEYHAFRKDLYQLYYLMVHVNLFGASYAAAGGAATRVVYELG